MGASIELLWSVMVWFWRLLVPLLVLAIVKFVIDRRKKHQRFVELGIPGPKPSLLMGNLREMQVKGLTTAFTEWHNEYGKTFGFFEGGNPILGTTDVEIIKQVYIKDFSSFHSRKPTPLSDVVEKSILGAKGSDWKRLRMISSPTFSAKRMKEMSPLIHRLLSSLMESFEKKAEAGTSFDILHEFQQLTISVIGSCGFGLDIDAIKDPENVFLKNCRRIFEQIGKMRGFQKILIGSFFVFPALFKCLMRARTALAQSPLHWFGQTAVAIIETRKKSEVKRNDFIQLMLNAEGGGEAKVSDLEVKVEDDDTHTTNGAPPTTDSKGRDKKMTLTEMEGQCIVFLLAGYETTSTSLSFAAYEIATHPQIQEKLQAEIDEHLPGDTWPDYISVQKMTYLDMFFSEVMRLHTLGIGVTNRQCNQDCIVGGIPLVKGDSVQVLTTLVHMDKDLWGPEDPKDFVPERFTQERKSQRHPMAWLPFGGGPRNCVGMRFALMEVKICLAIMLKKFSILQIKETQVPLQVEKLGVPRPKDGVWIKLEKR